MCFKCYWYYQKQKTQIWGMQKVQILHPLHVNTHVSARQCTVYTIMAMSTEPHIHIFSWYWFLSHP